MTEEVTKLSEEMLDEVLTAFYYAGRFNYKEMSPELEEFLAMSSGLTIRILKRHREVLKEDLGRQRYS